MADCCAQAIDRIQKIKILKFSAVNFKKSGKVDKNGRGKNQEIIAKKKTKRGHIKGL